MFLLRWAARRAAANVACSPEVKERLREELALPAERVEVVLNGVPVPRPEEVAAALARRGAAREKAGASWPIVVTVGRLVDIKGQDQLVAAAPALLARFPAAQVVLVGDGPRLEDWRAQARRLGVEQRVTFTGHVESVQPLIESAHVYVSTSHYEGISIALLEAMAWKVPVVASDVPGNRSVVIPEVNGTFYPLGDTSALVEAIAGLALDGQKAERLAQGARASVEQGFSTAAMARSYEGVYARVMEAPG
jgi:glycosyltransferase involved in cell wall biosynthesis